MPKKIQPLKVLATLKCILSLYPHPYCFPVAPWQRLRHKLRRNRLLRLASQQNSLQIRCHLSPAVH